MGQVDNISAHISISDVTSQSEKIFENALSSMMVIFLTKHFFDFFIYYLVTQRYAFVIIDDSNQ